jgi:hypothetical protein
MPTIELCAIGQHEPINIASNAFALEIDQTIVSHRSLFQEDLAGLRGCIYHLGNKECETQGFFFGSQLLSEQSLSDEENLYLEFRPEVKLSVIDLMNAINDAPDTEYLLFLTDYQFGSADTIRGEFPTLEAFWRAHDAGLLRINALYSIGKDG